MTDIDSSFFQLITKHMQEYLFITIIQQKLYFLMYMHIGENWDNLPTYFPIASSAMCCIFISTIKDYIDVLYCLIMTKQILHKCYW